MMSCWPLTNKGAAVLGSPFYRGGGGAAREGACTGSQSGRWRAWGSDYFPGVQFLGVMLEGFPGFASSDQTGSLTPLWGRFLPERVPQRKDPWRVAGAPWPSARVYSCYGHSSPGLGLGCAQEAGSSPAFLVGSQGAWTPLPQASSSVGGRARFDLCSRPQGILSTLTMRTGWHPGGRGWAAVLPQCTQVRNSAGVQSGWPLRDCTAHPVGA